MKFSDTRKDQLPIDLKNEGGVYGGHKKSKGVKGEDEELQDLKKERGGVHVNSPGTLWEQQGEESIKKGG